MSVVAFNEIGQLLLVSLEQVESAAERRGKGLEHFAWIKYDGLANMIVV